jgi:formate dehydrogenase maturation protein FdhE
MSIAPRLSEWLEQPEQQARLSALSAATTLPEMVMVALQLGLMVARWWLESDLTRRAQAPEAWGNCPHCGSRLHSKGFQSRQMQTLVGAIA